MKKSLQYICLFLLIAQNLMASGTKPYIRISQVPKRFNSYGSFLQYYSIKALNGVDSANLFYRNEFKKAAENYTDYLPLTGGTLTGSLIGTTADFTGAISIGSAAVSNGFIKSAEGIYFNSDYDASGAAPIVFGTGRSGFSGGTEWGRFTTVGAFTVNSTITATAFIGNASSASALQTARTINGVSFDGSANVNIINGTGFVKASGSTLSYDNSSYLTTSSASTTYLPFSGGTLTGSLVGTNANFTGALSIGSACVTNGFINSSEGIYFNTDYDGSGAGHIVFGTARSGFTGGSEWMRITEGNVGIGTNSPLEKLSVNGNISAKKNHRNPIRME